MYDFESGSSSGFGSSSRSGFISESGSGSGSGSDSECVHYSMLCNGISDCSSDFDETIGLCDGNQVIASSCMHVAI